MLASLLRHFMEPLASKTPHHRRQVQGSAGGGVDPGQVAGHALFAILKTGDHDKTGFWIRHEERTASVEALHASLTSRWLLPFLSEGVILNGSGAYLGPGWQPTERERARSESVRAFRALRQSDDELWRSYHDEHHQKAHCPALYRHWQSWDPILMQRVLNNLLAQKWCAHAIRRHEQRHDMRFDVVAYTRPDYLRTAPMKPWCEWQSDLALNSVVCPFWAMDGVWLTPRKHLSDFTDQPEAYSKCVDWRQPEDLSKGSFHKPPTPSCCYNAEALLAHSILRTPRQPNGGGCEVASRTTILRGVQRLPPLDKSSPRVNSRGYRHVCDVVLKANYGNGAYAESIVKTMGGLSVQAGRALRELFGDDILACREALMPFDQASRIHQHPEHWDPFALHDKRGRQVI